MCVSFFNYLNNYKFIIEVRSFLFTGAICNFCTTSNENESTLVFSRLLSHLQCYRLLLPFYVFQRLYLPLWYVYEAGILATLFLLHAPYYDFSPFGLLLENDLRIRNNFFLFIQCTGTGVNLVASHLGTHIVHMYYIYGVFRS